jgi:hypothetical protein
VAAVGPDVLGPHALAWLGGPGLSGPSSRLARWVGGVVGTSSCLARGSGSFGPIQLPGSVGRGLTAWLVRPGGARPSTGGTTSAGSHPGWMLGSDRPVQAATRGCRWAGVAVRWPSGRGQLPAALVDRPMVGSAGQGQVGQVGGAAVGPVPQVVALAPGQGSGAVGEHTAAVADGQGAALGRGDDPGTAAHIQRQGRRAPQDRGQPVHGRPQPHSQPLLAAGTSDRRALIAAEAVVAGLAGDHHPGQGPVTSQPPTRLGTERPHAADPAAEGVGVAEEAGQVHGHIELGSHTAALGQLPLLQVAAGQLDQGVGAALVTAALIVGAGRGSRAAARIWPASGSSSPCRSGGGRRFRIAMLS